LADLIIFKDIKKSVNQYCYYNTQTKRLQVVNFTDVTILDLNIYINGPNVGRSKNNCNVGIYFTDLCQPKRMFG